MYVDFCIPPWILEMQSVTYTPDYLIFTIFLHFIDLKPIFLARLSMIRAVGRTSLQNIVIVSNQKVSKQRGRNLLQSIYLDTHLYFSPFVHGFVQILYFIKITSIHFFLTPLSSLLLTNSELLPAFFEWKHQLTIHI